MGCVFFFLEKDFHFFSIISRTAKNWGTISRVYSYHLKKYKCEVSCDSFAVTWALSAVDSLYNSVTSTKLSPGCECKKMKSSQPLCWDAFAPCFIVLASILSLCPNPLCSCTPSFLSYSILSHSSFLCCNLSDIFSAASHISLPPVFSVSLRNLWHVLLIVCLQDLLTHYAHLTCCMKPSSCPDCATS